MTERVDILDTPTWFLQPGDRIVQSIVEELLAEPTFKLIFGDRIDPYMRMDYGARDFPALRIYSLTGVKEAETWYLAGDVTADIIFPASLRREEWQKLPDLVTAALLAMFRAQPFFERIRAKVPGLNQLGWRFGYDKTNAFRMSEADDMHSLTRLTINFRVNLNEWDEYLESDDRTPEQPFERTLGDLRTLYLSILGKDDSGATQVTVLLQIKITT